MAVCTDQRIRKRLGHITVAPGRDDLGEVLQIDLVDDAGCGRHDAEVIEGLLTPAEKLVALAIADKLEILVDAQGVRGGEGVDLYGVIDDQIDRHQRIDLSRITAQADHRRSHRRQINQRRNAGEILKHHAGRHERKLPLLRGFRIPGRQDRHIVVRGESRADVTQEVLQQDPDAEGQVIHAPDAVVGQLLQPVDLDGTGHGLQGSLHPKGIVRIRRGHVSLSEGRFLSRLCVSQAASLPGRAAARSEIIAATWRGCDTDANRETAPH